MSKASTYGVTLIEKNLAILNDIFGNTFVGNEPEVAAGDVIAYLLHWVEARYDGEDCEYDEPALEALRQGEGHFEVERGEGDDIANDPSYDDMIVRLETT